MNLYFSGAFNLDEFIHSPNKCNAGIFFSEFLPWDMKVTREKTGLGGISPHQDFPLSLEWYLDLLR